MLDFPLLNPAATTEARPTSPFQVSKESIGISPIFSAESASPPYEPNQENSEICDIPEQ